MIYLAVLEDRHCDDEYAAFTNVEDAIAHAKTVFKGYYKGQGYRFRETPIDGWLLYLETQIGDGPTIRVESIKLDGK